MTPLISFAALRTPEGRSSLLNSNSSTWSFKSRAAYLGLAHSLCGNYTRFTSPQVKAFVHELQRTAFDFVSLIGIHNVPHSTLTARLKNEEAFIDIARTIAHEYGPLLRDWRFRVAWSCEGLREVTLSRNGRRCQAVLGERETKKARRYIVESDSESDADSDDIPLITRRPLVRARRDADPEADYKPSDEGSTVSDEDGDRASRSRSGSTFSDLVGEYAFGFGSFEREECVPKLLRNLNFMPEYQEKLEDLGKGPIEKSHFGGESGRMNTMKTPCQNASRIRPLETEVISNNFADLPIRSPRTGHLTTPREPPKPSSDEPGRFTKRPAFHKAPLPQRSRAPVLPTPNSEHPLPCTKLPSSRMSLLLAHDEDAAPPTPDSEPPPPCAEVHLLHMSPLPEPEEASTPPTPDSAEFPAFHTSPSPQHEADAPPPTPESSAAAPSPSLRASPLPHCSPPSSSSSKPTPQAPPPPLTTTPFLTLLRTSYPTQSARLFTSFASSWLRVLSSFEVFTRIISAWTTFRSTTGYLGLLGAFFEWVGERDEEEQFTALRARARFREDVMQAGWVLKGVKEG
ncbi:hypothetical protein BU23DRAFT_597131 [Bimuria novae-zelandiae CBS 107.79]|uniref:Uncharacterized protein n=1 Tax=Bimuria novae-zelandiae CBS 107.79 TaxID=1447943 RepID=A0A6A5VSR0_9PLEO|nr:hypothetical protein BU23DRAFT_597131 [Bimuria novae-zelandiae CBS 107.79]